MQRFALILFLLGATCLTACGDESRPSTVLPVTTGEFVAGVEDSFPRVHYERAGTTLNDRCMVRRVKLNRKMPPMYVNNLPVGFC